MSEANMYYILSLKWTRSGEEIATWWGPNNSGYVCNLDEAGKYTADQVQPRCSYYDNRDSTIAIPCHLADKHAIRIMHTDALHSLVSETLNSKAYIHAPFQDTLDDDGKPYECKECETRPTHKGPSKIIVRGDAP